MSSLICQWVNWEMQEVTIISLKCHGFTGGGSYGHENKREAPLCSPLPRSSWPTLAAVGYILHLFVGSVLAARSILIPPLVVFATQFRVPSFAPVLIKYTTAVMGIALPFHNLMILVGVGKVGHFTERETLRFFPAQTLITLWVVAFQIGWWILLGRL